MIWLINLTISPDCTQCSRLGTALVNCMMVSVLCSRDERCGLLNCQFCQSLMTHRLHWLLRRARSMDGQFLFPRNLRLEHKPATETRGQQPSDMTFAYCTDRWLQSECDDSPPSMFCNGSSSSSQWTSFIDWEKMCAIVSTWHGDTAHGVDEGRRDKAGAGAQGEGTRLWECIFVSCGAAVHSLFKLSMAKRHVTFTNAALYILRMRDLSDAMQWHDATKRLSQDVCPSCVSYRGV